MDFKGSDLTAILTLLMKAYSFPVEPSPGWLTEVLYQNGILDSGEVISIEIIDTGAFNSRTIRLKLNYSSEVQPSAPTGLVLKRNTAEAWSKTAGADEVKFYQLAAKFGDLKTVIPACYAAFYDESSGNSYLLLKDLSETHAPPITRDDQISIIRGVPKKAFQESVIDTLALIHAFWWNHPKLTSNVFEIGFWSRNEQRFEKYLDKRRASWQTLLAEERPWFSAGLENFYRKLFGTLPSFWETYLAPRFHAQKNLTLIHGDSYFCNFLCPKSPGLGPTYLMDWQSPGWDLGGYDLANLLAAFWTRAQRQEGGRELNLLQRYFAGLRAHGIQNYSWENLCADYQAGLIFWVLMPVQDGADGSPKAYWWPKMQCLVDAFVDWQCFDLLDGNPS